MKPHTGQTMLSILSMVGVRPDHEGPRALRVTMSREEVFSLRLHDSGGMRTFESALGGSVDELPRRGLAAARSLAEQGLPEAVVGPDRQRVRIPDQWARLAAHCRARPQGERVRGGRALGRRVPAVPALH